jgi:hypothetical protein
VFRQAHSGIRVTAVWCYPGGHPHPGITGLRLAMKQIRPRSGIIPLGIR